MGHVCSPQAESDLDDIWFYLVSETGNVDLADRVVDSIASRLFLIANYPRIGRPRDDIRTGLRSLTVGGYVVFYRIDNEDVVILRILHGKRDIARLLEKD